MNGKKIKVAIKDDYQDDSDVEASPSQPTQRPSPTGFFSLPLELRQGIYRLCCLPLKTVHRYAHYHPANPWGPNALTIVHTYPSCGTLLAVCRQLHWELTTFLNGNDSRLGRERIRIIGGASCLDTPTFRGVLHCATHKFHACQLPRELVSSLPRTGPLRNPEDGSAICSHEDLHSLLDGVGWVRYPLTGAVGKRPKKILELAIEDPGNRSKPYWTGLAHDVPRFDTWARTKSRELRVRVEIVVRPALMSKLARRYWEMERPLVSRVDVAGTSAVVSNRVQGVKQKITRSEGKAVEDEEWVDRWVDVERPRTGWRRELVWQEVQMRSYRE